MVLTQNIDTLDTVLTCSLRVFTHDNNGCMSSYYQRTVNIYCYTSSKMTTLKYTQVQVSIVLSLEKIYQNVCWNVRGVLTSVSDLIVSLLRTVGLIHTNLCMQFTFSLIQKSETNLTHTLGSLMNELRLIIIHF